MKKRLISIVLIFIMTFSISFSIYDNYRLCKNKVYAVDTLEEIKEKIIVLLCMAGIKVQNATQFDDLPERFQEIEMQGNAVWCHAVQTALTAEAFVLTITPEIKEALADFKQRIVDESPYKKITYSIDKSLYDSMESSATGCYSNQLFFEYSGNYYLYTCEYPIKRLGASDYTSSYGTNVSAYWHSYIFNSSGNMTTDMGKHQTNEVGTVPETNNVAPTTETIDYTPNIDWGTSIADYPTGTEVDIKPNTVTQENVIGKSSPTVIGTVTTLPDTISDTETETDILTRIYNKVIGIPSQIGSTFSSITDTTVTDTDTPTLNWQPISGVLQNKFPFCIPWDIKDMVVMFVAERQTPKFDVAFPELHFGDYTMPGYKFTIDFSGFDKIVLLLRFFILSEFIFYIITITRNQIRG